MKKQSWLARAFLLGVSLLSSIDAVSASWLITGDHTDKADTTASISTNNTTAVCYIKETGVYYTSLDKALYVAEKVRAGVKDTICVIPNLGSNVTIGDPHTIESVDSLVLPYAYEKSDKSVIYIACGMNVETWKTDGITNDMIHGDNSVTFADQDDKSIETYRQTRVVLGTGKYTVNLTVNGNLLIGGKLSNPTTGVSGQTAGSYCEMVLSKYAHIKCDGGKIECDGYIKRSSATGDYSSLIVTDGGTLKTPLVIYDFKGGSYTYAAATATDKVSPFYVFDFPNVQTSVQVNYGSYWETKICVYADNSYLPADGLYFIAPSSDDTSSDESISDESINPILVQKSSDSSDSVIYVDYAPSSHGYTSSAVDSTKTSIAIKGEVDIGSINFEYNVSKTTQDGEVSKISVPIDSSSFYLPISYRFDFVLKKDSILSSSKKIKFMNGSSVLIESGATLNVTGPMAIYGSDFKDDASGTSIHYPTVTKDGAAIGGATFINNGTINVTDGGVIGGVIATSVDDDSAVLNYATTTYTIKSPETASIEGENIKAVITSKTYSCTATGRYFVFNDDDTIASETEKYAIQYNYYCSAQNSTTKTKGWSASLLSISVVDSGYDDDSGWVNAKAKINPIRLEGFTFTWGFVRNVNDYLSHTDADDGTTTIKNETVSEAPVYVSITATKGDESYQALKKIAVPGKNKPEEPAALDKVKVYVYSKDANGEYTIQYEQSIEAKASTTTTQTINVLNYERAIDDSENPIDYSWKIKVVTEPEGAIKDNVISYEWSFLNMTTKTYQCTEVTFDGETHTTTGSSGSYTFENPDPSNSASAIEMNIHSQNAIKVSKNPTARLKITCNKTTIISTKNKWLLIVFKTKS